MHPRCASPLATIEEKGVAHSWTHEQQQQQLPHATMAAKVDHTPGPPEHAHTHRAAARVESSEWGKEQGRSGRLQHKEVCLVAKRAVVVVVLHAVAVDAQAVLGHELLEHVAVVLGEAPLAAETDLLAAGELELGAAQRLDAGILVHILGAHRDEGLDGRKEAVW